MDVLSAAHRAGGGGGLFILGLFIFLVAATVAAVKVLPKVGYSAWFAVLVWVPVVNIVMVLVFAFSDWPVDKELRRYRQGGYGPGPGGYPAPSWPAQPPPGYGPGRPQFPPSGWPTAPGGSPPPWPGGSEPAAPGS
jgi:hypothetical protein